MRLNYLLSTLIILERIFFSTSVPIDDAKKVKDLVNDDGYQLETHYVETEDGYILEMHRIPRSRASNESTYKKHPVYVKHGLGECSVLFLLTGPKRALAYLLVDKGYDVWLGNSRGSIFSRNHSQFLSSSFGFWNFSWHEIGLYDDSAMMDYVLQHTENNKLFYICHSQGCTELFVLVSLRTEYNDKIHLAVNLAPAIFLEHLSGLARIGSSFSHIASYIFEKFGHVNALDGSTWLRVVTNYFCHKEMFTQHICIFIINSIAGFSSFMTDKNVYNKFLTYFPSGGSSKQLFHYGFGAHSPAEFRQYDYGRKINEIVYNSRLPPKYPLQKATLPVAIFYGSKDFLAPSKDVEFLIETLPNVTYTKLIEGFNHFDFLIGINVRNKVYEEMLQLLENYRKKIIY